MMSLDEMAIRFSLLGRDYISCTEFCQLQAKSEACSARILELHALIGSKGLGQTGLQLQALRFAGGGIGYVLSKQNDLGPLGERKAAPAELQQDGFGWRRRPLARYDIGSDLLAVVPVLERHGHRELDAGVSLQHVVNLQRRGLDPAADDQLLDPAGDEE